MRRKVAPLVSTLLALVFIPLPGCQQSQQGSQKPSPSPTTKAKLIGINFAYHNFCAVFRKSPGKIEELAPYVVGTTFPESFRKMEEEWLAELKKGEIVVIWSQQGAVDAKKGTDIVTAYERRTPIEGGFVVFADGRVEWMTPAEFERTPKRAETARPETKLTIDLPDRDTMKSELEQALRGIGDERAKQDLIGLQGLWEVAKIERGQLALPGPVKVGDPCLIVGDKIRFKHRTWDGTVRFSLDATKTPKQIDTFAVNEGEQGVQGIYALTRDEFKLYYNLGIAERPNDFATKDTDRRMLFVLKRISREPVSGKSAASK
jgi:uncharacterized protein (TIGR03067 family)